MAGPMGQPLAKWILTSVGTLTSVGPPPCHGRLNTDSSPHIFHAALGEIPSALPGSAKLKDWCGTLGVGVSDVVASSWQSHYLVTCRRSAW